MLIDLFTYDPALEAKILGEYKGELFPNSQHNVDKTGEDHLYCFYDLNPTILAEILKEKKHEYELRDSNTGKPIPKDLAAFIENLKHP